MKNPNLQIEVYRIKHPIYSDEGKGNNGYFEIPFGLNLLSVIASDGLGWDHVSVSNPDRMPTWEEMCFIKDMFFDKDETVIQFHPRADKYKNYCETCLHLWRKQGSPENGGLELPHDIMI